MAKQKKDLRIVDLQTERQVALADPRLPERQVNKPVSLPGVYKGKIKNMDQLKAYIAKIPPAPKDCK